MKTYEEMLKDEIVDRAIDLRYAEKKDDGIEWYKFKAAIDELLHYRRMIECPHCLDGQHPEVYCPNQKHPGT